MPFSNLQKSILGENVKDKGEISETWNRSTIKKINASKVWFFEKINTIDKPLARVINTGEAI